MSRQITFDWQIDEEEFERRLALHGDETPSDFLSDGERRLALIVLRSLAALLIMTAAAASTAFSPSQIERIETEEDLRVVLGMDADAWRGRDKDGYNALIDPQVDGEWVGVWRDNWGARSETGHIYTLTLGPTQRLNEELVQAEVHVTLPRTTWWRSSVRRETRFYRQAHGLWLRTLPPDSFWGERLTLETSSFTFHYYAPDAESVRAAAEKLDRAYAELHRILGLGPIGAGERVVVVVIPGLVHTWSWGGGELHVTSPILSQVPQGLSDAEYLADRVLSRIAAGRLSDGSYSRATYDWAFLVMVLRGWLGSELLDQPSAWRAEGDAVFRTHAPYTLPLELVDLHEFLVDGRSSRDTVLWRYAAATSLLDYVVARGGRAALPALLSGFSRHGAWPALIEDVFGVSVEEFTEGWNRYLVEEYGLGPADAE
jgi:hypothetical protein